MVWRALGLSRYEFRFLISLNVVSLLDALQESFWTFLRLLAAIWLDLWSPAFAACAIYTCPGTTMYISCCGNIHILMLQSAHPGATIYTSRATSSSGANPARHHHTRVVNDHRPLSRSNFLKTNRRVEEHVCPLEIVARSVVLAVMGL